MDPATDKGLGWRDEGFIPVFLLLVSYVWPLLPLSILWTVIGLSSLLLGALLTVAMWRGASLHGREVSRATRWAIWMLKLWVLWALLSRAAIQWPAN